MTPFGVPTPRLRNTDLQRNVILIWNVIRLRTVDGCSNQVSSHRGSTHRHVVVFIWLYNNQVTGPWPRVTQLLCLSSSSSSRPGLHHHLAVPVEGFLHHPGQLSSTLHHQIPEAKILSTELLQALLLSLTWMDLFCTIPASLELLKNKKQKNQHFFNPWWKFNETCGKLNGGVDYGITWKVRAHLENDKRMKFATKSLDVTWTLVGPEGLLPPPSFSTALQTLPFHRQCRFIPGKKLRFFFKRVFFSVVCIDVLLRGCFFLCF